VLHRAAYTALGLTDWRYEARDCGAEQLPAVLDGLDSEWVGLSLTMPLKRAVLPLADEVSELARAVGAANTLLLTGGRRADNTDVTGITDALREAGAPAPRRPVLLGAGGTASAALAALRLLVPPAGPPVAAVVRDTGRARELVQAATRLGVQLRLATWPGAEELSRADLVISTVPAGAADALAGGGWGGAGTTVLDAVYGAAPTPLIRAAAAAGCRVVPGQRVLLHQAARQVRLMTGLEPPLRAMDAALARALSR